MVTQDVLDIGGNKHHGMIKNPQHVQRWQPPIVGMGASYRLEDPGYLEMGTLGDFGSQMESGFSVLIDFQTESAEEQIIFGTAVSGKTALIARLNASGVLDRLELEVRDDTGRLVKGYIQLSKAAAKRLIIIIAPSDNLIRVDEVTIHGANVPRTEYLDQQSPVEFANFEYPLLISGYNLDGSRQGRFVGRVSQVAWFDKCLSEDEADDIAKAARSDIEQTYGTRPDIPCNAER